MYRIAIFIITFISIMTNLNGQGKPYERKPAVAGSFYPADKNKLIQQLEKCFNEYNPETEQPLALILPHAGYVFSGSVAAAGIKMIPQNTKFQHIFIIGSSHTHNFNGVCIYPKGSFITPLGKINIDPLAEQIAKKSNFFITDTNIHFKEHSLEVILPFLQYWLKSDFSIIPIIIGGNHIKTSQELANTLKPYFNKNNLIIISSDFSHYPSYNDAIYSDSRMAEAIISGKAKNFLQTKEKLESQGIYNLSTAACGWTSILTLLYMVETCNNCYLKKIAYKNSGDSPYGSNNRVVGYNTIGVFQKKNEFQSLNLSDDEKIKLLHITRQTLKEYVVNKNKYQIPHSFKTNNLLNYAGVFVTLYKNNQLRGCIGTFNPEHPLYHAVQSMTISAAAHDYRFSPVSINEINEIEIEISVLSPLQKITSIDQIQIGKHGIYIKKGKNSGTFLPKVAEQNNWTKEEFLSHCAYHKAGLNWDGWKDADIYIYETLVIHEKDFNIK